MSTFKKGAACQGCLSRNYISLSFNIGLSHRKVKRIPYSSFDILDLCRVAYVYCIIYVCSYVKNIKNAT